MLIDNLEIALLSDGFFKLDGGAMFGIVPKTIWNKYNLADELNRISLALKPLLIKTESKTVIIDTGIGNKLSQRLSNVFSIDHSKTDLINDLIRFNLEPKDVDIVILTHLHLDHAGWNTVIENGRFVPTFPNAEYIIQKGEWKSAVAANERNAGSYIQENFCPLEEHKQLLLVDGSIEFIEGINLTVTGGHTKYHQIVLIGKGKQKAIYWGDIMPTTTHLKPPYIMGYDLYPQDTLRIKKKFISEAIENKWLCLWCHDPEISSGYLTRDRNDSKIRINNFNF